MDKQPNLYEQFLKDIHPELIDQFKRFIKEKDIYKQFVQFAHPEFDEDFKKYTEKMPVYNSYRLLSSFLEEWNKANNKQKEKLRKGLGYNIGFR